MRAVLMTAVGAPVVLKIAEVPEPEVTAEHDVRVRLRAAGVNPVDCKLRSGGTIGGSLPLLDVSWANTRQRQADSDFACTRICGRQLADLQHLGRRALPVIPCRDHGSPLDADEG
jgi:hypothetical protein